MSTVNLGNLTLILGSYACDRTCPHCIAKNNQKFNTKDDQIEKIAPILARLQEENVKFEKFVISGNGEPSLYSLDDIKKIAEAVKKHEDMFKEIEVQTSGNLFFENEKLELLKKTFADKLAVNISKFSVSNWGWDKTTTKMLEDYENPRDYMATDAFKNTPNINLDIVMHNYLDYGNLRTNVITLREKFPNISNVRLKHAVNCSGQDKSKQSEWVKKNKFTGYGVFMGLDDHDKEKRNSGKYDYADIFEIDTSNPSCDYFGDLVISKGTLMDYNEKPVTTIDENLK